jgi:RNA polymerase sigma-70 factor (ECF subfamily)
MMCKQSPEQVRDVIEQVYRSDSQRVYATLVRLIGDLDAAEEALHEAFAAAIERWTRDGVPAQPRAWLVSAGRFKAIDTLRRRTRHNASVQEMARLDRLSRPPEPTEGEDIAATVVPGRIRPELASDRLTPGNPATVPLGDCQSLRTGAAM